MLDLRKLRRQLEDVTEAQAGTAERREHQRRRALRALREVGDEWKTVRDDVERAQPSRLVAALCANPVPTRTAPDRPDAVTVVATDGSQIYPDRHVEPTYFLLNIGRVAFHYGTTEAPLMDAVPDLRFPEELDEHFDDVLATMTTEIVSALRDEQELAELLAVSREHRVDGRPLVAMADGTLIRWMLRGMQNRAVEQALIRRYTDMLRGFMDDELPIASYVSMPGTTEVVNLLRFHLNELDDEAPDRWRSPRSTTGGSAPDSNGATAGPAPSEQVAEPNAALTPKEAPSPDGQDAPLAGLLDRHLFDEHLDAGERSAVFGSTSHIQREYPEGNEICYFYLKIPVGEQQTEIARVELPAWVADRPVVVDLIHAVTLTECVKGDGYPLILSEAHERAVIRAPEREAFQRLLDRTFRRAGLPHSGSRKRRSKQRPKV